LTTEAQFVTVGKLGRTRGVFGEMYITPTTDFPDRFLGLKEIYVNDRGTWVKMKIVSSKMISGRPVVRLANVSNLEQAARLTNRELALPREQLVKLPEDQFYIFDMVGCDVYRAATDEKLGEIVDVIQYPANDVYVIRTIGGAELMCPAVKQYVTQIDMERKRVTIVTDGLLDPQ
jgi:16S rRNA processing protein RimM